MTKQEHIDKLLELLNVDKLLENEKQLQEEIFESISLEENLEDEFSQYLDNSNNIREFMNRGDSTETLKQCLQNRLAGVNVNSLKAYISYAQALSSVESAILMAKEDFYQLALPQETEVKH